MKRASGSTLGLHVNFELEDAQFNSPLIGSIGLWDPTSSPGF